MAKAALRNWLRNLLGLTRRGRATAFPQDSELLKYFTNVEHIVEYFNRQLGPDPDRRRLLVIHGLGGMGKSSLLAKLRSIAVGRRVGLAHFSAASAPTPFQVFVEFSRTMRQSGVRTRLLEKAIKKYASLRDTVSTESSKLPGTLREAGGTVGSTFDATSGAGAGFGKAGTETLDLARGVLTRSDFELYLDPTRYLTDAFVADLERLRADSRRCVVMLDTYERFIGTDQWVREFVVRAREHALIVIAGRDTPAWDRDWPGWMAEACVEELHPMSAENVRILIRRYYAAIHGGEPAPLQVDAIVAFARGIPLVVTIAVRLWVKYHYADFSTVKPQAITDAVDCVMEGVPPTLRSWIEAAAAVRWYNQQLLQDVVGKDLDDETYSQLSRFPFVRPHKHNAMIHDAMRDIVDDNCRTQNPARHSELHRSAAAVFKKVWTASPDDDHLPYLFEWLFHTATGDGALVRDTIRSVGEELAATGRVRQLGALVSDLSTITRLDHETVLWLRHYSARALQLDGKVADAEALFVELCGAAPEATILKRYAHCGLAGLITRWDRLGTSESRGRALDVVGTALSGDLDPYLASALFCWARLSVTEGDWDNAVSLIGKARTYFDDIQDRWGVVRALNELQGAAVLRGDWEALLSAQDAAVALLSPPTINQYLRARSRGYWVWGLVFAGECRRAELQARDSASVAILLEDSASRSIYQRNVGLALSMQDRHAEGIDELRQALSLSNGLGKGFAEVHATTQALLGLALVRAGEYIDAGECLEAAQRTKTDVGDVLGMPDTLVWRGQLALVQGQNHQALTHYQESLIWKWTGRRHCESEALLGVCRALYAVGAHGEAIAALAKAQPKAKLYNEHSAWLEALRGHLLLTHSTGNDRSDAAVEAYGAALIHALRHNRFALDAIVAEIRRKCDADPLDGATIIARLAEFWNTTAINERSDQLVDGGAGVMRVQLTKREATARTEEPGDPRKRQATVIEVLS